MNSPNKNSLLFLGVDCVLEKRLNEIRSYIEKNQTNPYSDDASKWLQGYDQRMREEAKWLEELILIKNLL